MEVAHVLKDCGRDLHENTPLHIASKHGYEGIVDWILEQTDVELNGLNVAGDTPLILAASYGHLEIVRKVGVWDMHFWGET